MSIVWDRCINTLRKMLSILIHLNKLNILVDMAFFYYIFRDNEYFTKCSYVCILYITCACLHASHNCYKCSQIQFLIRKKFNNVMLIDMSPTLSNDFTKLTWKHNLRCNISNESRISICFNIEENIERKKDT